VKGVKWRGGMSIRGRGKETKWTGEEGGLEERKGRSTGNGEMRRRGWGKERKGEEKEAREKRELKSRKGRTKE
jgi:hypothetical protein